MGESLFGLPEVLRQRPKEKVIDRRLREEMLNILEIFDTLWNYFILIDLLATCLLISFILNLTFWLVEKLR